MAWKIHTDFKGYVNKVQKTKLPPGHLIAGSKNVLSTDDDLIATRKGRTLLGAANTALNPIESSFEWASSTGDELVLRSYDDELEFLYNNTTWYKLKESWSAVNFQYAAYYDTTEKLDLILFVNGDANIYSWSGGQTTYASLTSNTITKQGTATWAEKRFLTTGSVRILDSTGTWREYAYTGGIGTTTLTGVTPDPTATYTFTAGTVCVQSVVTTSNKPTTLWKNDIIGVLNNQIFIGSNSSNQVYQSAVDDFDNFTPAATVGSPKLYTLDATISAFIPGEEFMYISAGNDFWYQIKNQLSADLQAEETIITRLKTGTMQGAYSQGAVEAFKNYIAFISNEPTLDFLGRVENVENAQQKPLSDPIKIDFDTYNFTNVHVKYFRNNIYIALPSQSLVLVYNINKGYWEAPQVLPVRRLAIINGELCGHSNSVPETYKLFTGYNDNDLPIEAIARFSYENYGDRVAKKNFTKWYNELFITSNTEVVRKIYFDYQGANGTKVATLKGNERKYTIIDSEGGGLGKENLGKKKLAGDAPTDDMRKYRKINTEQLQDFYEICPEYSSYGVDQRWAILAFGADVSLSKNSNYEITQ